MNNSGHQMAQHGLSHEQDEVQCAYCWAWLRWDETREMQDGRFVHNNQNLSKGVKGCRGFLWEDEHKGVAWEGWTWKYLCLKENH